MAATLSAGAAATANASAAADATADAPIDVKICSAAAPALVLLDEEPDVPPKDGDHSMLSQSGCTTPAASSTTVGPLSSTTAVGATAAAVIASPPVTYRSADTKHFVGGFGNQLDEMQIRAYFERFGAVSDVRVMRDSLTGMSRGFGFVTMADPSSRGGIYKVAEHRIEGRRISVRPYTLTNGDHDPSILLRKVFVGGVSSSVTEETLRKYFSEFGDPEEVILMKYSDGRPRGFAFVLFKDVSGARKVLAQRVHRVTDSESVEVKPCVARNRMLLRPPGERPRSYLDRSVVGGLVGPAAAAGGVPPMYAYGAPGTSGPPMVYDYAAAAAAYAAVPYDYASPYGLTETWRASPQQQAYTAEAYAYWNYYQNAAAAAPPAAAAARRCRRGRSTPY